MASFRTEFALGSFEHAPSPCDRRYFGGNARFRRRPLRRSAPKRAFPWKGAPFRSATASAARLRSNGADEVLVPVAATYAASGKRSALPIQLHFIAGESISRVLQSLDLTKLGLTGTLHLTLAFSHGLVHVEGALLTPGAITIK